MAPKRQPTVQESSESSESSESPQPPVPPKVPQTPQKETKATNTRGIRRDGTLTETARIYMILKFDSTKARALQTEHIRTLIRQSGCTGEKHESAHELMYTILFGDATTLLHFRQFQGMWEYRTLSPTAGGPRAEWWTAFRWFLRDCFSKAKTQIDKSGFAPPKSFSDEAGEGVMLLYLRHTSASLVIQENADPDVQTDLITALHRLAPTDGPWVHTAEGPDDMPGHIKAMLAGVSLHVPVRGGALALGTWQGIYLVEHRARPHRREVMLQFIGSKA